MLFNFTVEGNLASQPRLTATQSGVPVCVVRILHNSRYRKGNEWVFLGVGASTGLCWRAFPQVRRR